MSSELRAQEIYACGSTPPSPHFVSTDQFTTPQGITITRYVDSGKRLTPANFTTGCGRRIGANYLQMGANGTRRVVYTFSKPISSVMIWFFDLGDASQHWRKTKTYVSLNCANGGLFTQEIGGTDCLNSAGIIADKNPKNTRAIIGDKGTDIGIRFYVKDLNQAFTEIVIEDATSYYNDTYAVEICPNSIVSALVVKDQPTDQLSCSNSPVTFTSKVQHTFDNIPTNQRVTYVWQYAANGVDFSNIGNEQAVPKINARDFDTVSLPLSGTDLKEGYYRAKFVIKDVSLPCGGRRNYTFEAHSRAAKLTKGDAQSVNLLAVPNRITQGVNTSVNFRLKGAANATITYSLSGGVTESNKQIVLDANGEADFTKNINQATTMVVNKIQSGGCVNNTPNVSVDVTASSNNDECLSIPSAHTYTNGKATIGGVEVTRTILADNEAFPNESYSRDYCGGGSITRPYPMIGNTPTNSKISYKFSKPITQADVFLMVFGAERAGNIDKAKITINNGARPTVTKLYDCNNAAILNQNTVSSNKMQNGVTDVGLRVTASDPFTEIIIGSGILIVSFVK